MRERSVLLIGILLFFSITGTDMKAQAQRGTSNVEPIRHVLFGDITVEGEMDPKEIPQSVRVILKTISGQIWARDSISLGGRYRFNNISNGEYYVEVEIEDRIIMRQHVMMQEQRSSDRRLDIALALSGGQGENLESGILYARSEHNQDLFDNAQNLISRDPKKAATYLEEIVKKDPDDFEAWCELGTAHFQRGKEKDAQKAYENALKAKPDYLLAMINLSKLYIDKKKTDDAIAIATKAVETEAGSAEANYLLGEAYLMAKKGSKAVAYLNEALKLDPEGMADVHIRLGALYDMAGYKELAAKEYSKFLQKKPDYKDRKKMEKYISENGQK